MKLPVAARAALVVAALCGCAHPLLKESGEPLTRLVISNAGAAWEGGIGEIRLIVEQR